jgi:hypothetical protein
MSDSNGLCGGPIDALFASGNESSFVHACSHIDFSNISQDWKYSDVYGEKYFFDYTVNCMLTI